MGPPRQEAKQEGNKSTGNAYCPAHNALYQHRPPPNERPLGSMPDLKYERTQVSGAYVLEPGGLQEICQIAVAENPVNTPQRWRQPFHNFPVDAQKIGHDNHQSASGFDETEMLGNHRARIVEMFYEAG